MANTDNRVSVIRLDGIEAQIYDTEAHSLISNVQTEIAGMPKQTDITAVNGRIDTVERTAGVNATNIATNTSSIGDINAKFLDNAGAHNGIYRGNNLGNTITAAQYQAIASGEFTDMYIGDYWRINNINYRIADFDYYYNIGDTAFLKHHIVLVPDTSLMSSNMNAENVTTGGYLNSRFYTETLPTVCQNLTAIFGEHLTKHRIFMPNASSSSSYSSWMWIDSDVDLMSEVMVYGSQWWGFKGYFAEKRQLSLFQHRHDLIGNRTWYWLRDVVGSSSFAVVNSDGVASGSSASRSCAVRPAFVIS